MEDKLELFHEILFGNLRPSRTKNDHPVKFRELKKTIIREHYQHQPKYQINFFRPHTTKLEYYKDLVFNESIRYFNHILETAYAETEEDIKYLLVHNSLFTNLTDKLKQVSAEIDRLGYPISYIDPSSANKLKDTTLSENTYISQYLKITLIQLYLNIQDALGSFFEEDKLEEKDIYLNFFNEGVPVPSFLVVAKKVEVPIKKELIKKKVEVSFNPIYQDIRPIIKSKVDYSIVNNQELFGEVEKRLYEYELIDNEYYFIKNKKQSNHTLLAAVYKVLIKNNYFRRNKIGTHYKFTDLDIRKYLDERYSADTTQQFRRINEKQVEDAKLKLPWLDKIYRIS